MLPGPIALDATLWDEPTTGIGLYTRCLYDALLRRGANLHRFGARTTGEAPRRLSSRTAYLLAELPAALGLSRARLFHGVSNFNLPLTKIPGKRMVLTVHDLIPELFPATVSKGFRWQFRIWLARSLRVADRVVCVSSTTRDDLLRHFEIDPARVSVVLNGVDHVDRVAPLDRVGEQYLESLALPDRFVLYAGSLDARKNVVLVLEAFERLWRDGKRTTLVLSGQSWFGSGPAETRIAALRSEGLDIRPLGYLAEPEFYEVMRRATVFAFPSRYEGFGLPPLEAMRLGVPCVVSNAGSLPEVCGQAARYVTPDDADALARTLWGVLENPEERRHLADASRKQAAPMTWERAAEQTLEVYRAALGA
jgi:glycosyltransferase involved in cell wall biosynthesis